MRVYLQPPQPSRGLQRIADALVRYKPEWVEIVNKKDDADLVVLWAIGRRNALLAEGAEILHRQQEYAVIQVCLRSTQKPSTKDWRGLWRWATVVWSYYDLLQAVWDDGDDGEAFRHNVNFYHAPLGADATVFRDTRDEGHERSLLAVTSGLSRLSESVREVALAASKFPASNHAPYPDCNVYHLGPKLRLPENVRCVNGVTDEQLATAYSYSEFVSGLRRKEGFELPAIEGLLCGARPVVFDTPDYRWNYGNHALYIPEGSRDEVVDSLVEIFKRGAPPVTPEERELAVARYDWKKIVGGFYERLE